jgi:hypothetical protein
MRYATSLLYHVCAVASRNIRFASCGTSGKLSLWTCLVYAFLLFFIRSTSLVNPILLFLIVLCEKYNLRSSSLCSFLQSSVTTSLFGLYILLNTLSLCPSLNVRDQVLQPYTNTGYIIVSYIPVLSFHTTDERTKGSGWNSSKRYQNSVLF